MITRDLDEVHRRLADANPLPDGDASLADAVNSPRAAALHARILATFPEHEFQRPQTRPHPARRVAIAAGVVVVTVAVTGLPRFLGTGHQATAFAATPPMLHYQYTPATGPAAAGVLQQMSALAAQQQPIGTGDVDFVEYQEWGLSSAVSHHATSSWVQPTLLARWTTPDGQLYQASASATTQPLTPQSPNVVQPAPTNLGDNAATLVGSTKLFDLAQLSTDPVTLANQLLNEPSPSGQPASVIAPNFVRLDNILQLYRQQPIPATLQAAMWQVLADTPGWIDLGSVTDRLGRQGIAVAYESNYDRPTRYVLIFNPATGMLLGDEQIATTQVGNGPIDPLGVRIPAVLDYHAYIAAGHVPDTHTQL